MNKLVFFKSLIILISLTGKGGETIKNINTSTGAYCKVDKSAPSDAKEKNFIISGSPEAVKRAKAIIMKKIGTQTHGSRGCYNCHQEARQ